MSHCLRKKGGRIRTGLLTSLENFQSVAASACTARVGGVVTGDGAGGEEVTGFRLERLLGDTSFPVGEAGCSSRGLILNILATTETIRGDTMRAEERSPVPVPVPAPAPATVVAVHDVEGSRDGGEISSTPRAAVAPPATATTPTTVELPSPRALPSSSSSDDHDEEEELSLPVDRPNRRCAIITSSSSPP